MQASALLLGVRARPRVLSLGRGAPLGVGSAAARAVARGSGRRRPRAGSARRARARVRHGGGRRPPRRREALDRGGLAQRQARWPSMIATRGAKIVGREPRPAAHLLDRLLAPRERRLIARLARVRRTARARGRRRTRPPALAAEGRQQRSAWSPKAERPGVLAVVEVQPQLRAQVVALLVVHVGVAGSRRGRAPRPPALARVSLSEVRPLVRPCERPGELHLVGAVDTPPWPRARRSPRRALVPRRSPGPAVRRWPCEVGDVPGEVEAGEHHVAVRRSRPRRARGRSGGRRRSARPSGGRTTVHEPGVGQQRRAVALGQALGHSS